jgi:hypothetical protein
MRNVNYLCCVIKMLAVLVGTILTEKCAKAPFNKGVLLNLKHSLYLTVCLDI